MVDNCQLACNTCTRKNVIRPATKAPNRMRRPPPRKLAQTVQFPLTFPLKHTNFSQDLQLSQHNAQLHHNPVHHQLLVDQHLFLQQLPSKFLYFLYQHTMHQRFVFPMLFHHANSCIAIVCRSTFFLPKYARSIFTKTGCAGGNREK